MIVLYLKRWAFLVLFLTVHSSLLFAAADTDVVVVVPKKKAHVTLQSALEDFEAGNWQPAYTKLIKLSKAGGMIGSAYIQYMENKELVAVADPQDDQCIEPIPEAGLKLSSQYLNASLAYKDKDYKKLGKLAQANNAHAFSLIEKLLTNDLSLAKNKDLKIKSKFQPEHNGPVKYWNCLDPEYLLVLAAKGIVQLDGFKYFANNYRKGYSTGKLALVLAEKYTQQPFWAYLATENGCNTGCGPLGHYFYQNAIPGDNKHLDPQQTSYLEFSRYYMSRIQQNDLLPNAMAIECLKLHARMYYEGMHTAKTPCKELLYRKKSADRGDSSSQYNCGIMLRDGDGVEQDLKESLKYFKLAADQGNAEAQFNYAVMRLNGDGANSDLREAIDYFKRAADQELPDALTAYLDSMTKHGKRLARNGTGTPQEIMEAQQCFEMAANQNSQYAQHNLALMLYNGWNGVKDLPRARELFQKAADQGFAEAQHNLALMFYNGFGGVKDLPGARGFFQKTADQGVAMAQCNYAAMLYHGEGGKQDLGAALGYMQMAADQGLTEAAIMLHWFKAQENNEDKVHDEEDLKNVEIPMVTTDEDVADSPSISDEESDEGKASPAAEPQEPAAAVTAVVEVAQAAAAAAEAVAAVLPAPKAQSAPRHTLTVARNVYNRVGREFVVRREKTGVTCISHETLEFVETIFGSKAQRRINNYSNVEATKAFAELGCTIGNKKGENSTKLEFRLEEGKVVKFKYHNPHGHGDNKLYEALKPFMKRFLVSINKTPETLQLRVR